jgi:hypothetical protein
MPRAVSREGPPFTILGRDPLYRVDGFRAWLLAREIQPVRNGPRQFVPIDLGHDLSMPVTVSAGPILLAALEQPDQVNAFLKAKRAHGIWFGDRTTCSNRTGG